MVLKATLSASLEKPCDIRITRLSLSSTNSVTPAVGPHLWCFNKLSSWFWRMLKFENHRYSQCYRCNRSYKFQLKNWGSILILKRGLLKNHNLVTPWVIKHFSLPMPKQCNLIRNDPPKKAYRKINYKNCNILQSKINLIF